jgi:hypothetical protein
MSFILAHDYVCSIQMNEIDVKKKSDFFSLDIPVSSTDKTGCQDITEILLKEVIYPITNPILSAETIFTTYCLTLHTLLQRFL